MICRPSWQTRRFGSLCATDIFSAAKGRVLRSFISRSVPVIDEKPRNLKPAFVFFRKQQKGVRGLRNRRKRGLGPLAPNPVLMFSRSHSSVTHIENGVWGHWPQTLFSSISLSPNPFLLFCKKHKSGFEVSRFFTDHRHGPRNEAPQDPPLCC